MSRIGDRHREIINGHGLCSVPMWIYPGYPAGFCDKPAFGKETEEARRMERIRGTHRYVPALACVGHGGPTLVEYLKGKTVVRFDGPPSPEPGRFIEVERDGASISFGQWIKDGGDWLLVLPEPHQDP
ncbi:MAG: hypothetical protein KAJ55_00160 [Anaerolineales bacterium]|nr:hypothetical protein [Anaerolineales bacterium]